MNIFSKKKSKSIHHQNWKGINKEIGPSIIIILMGVILFLIFNSFNVSNILLLAFCILSGLFTSILIPYLINNFLGGHSGDSYGASLVITETIYLIILGVILVPN